MIWTLFATFLVPLFWNCASENVGDIRLLNGNHIYEGRVEVYLGSRGWFGTCDKQWSMSEAIVVCRQLGYPGAIMAVQNFAHTRGIPLSREWRCIGDEDSLLSCHFTPTYLCLEAAGVICHGPGYLGCYQDDFGALTSTLSENYVVESSMTVDRCREFCMNRHLRIVGLKNGNECYCGLSESELANHAKLSDAECQTPCPGNSREVCGGQRDGTDKLSVFDVDIGGCVNPGEPDNGRQIESSYNFGDIVPFACDPGYELVGVPAIQCILSTGGTGNSVMWSTSIPTCSLLPTTDAHTTTQGTPTPEQETTSKMTTLKMSPQKMTTKAKTEPMTSPVLSSTSEATTWVPTTKKMVVTTTKLTSTRGMSTTAQVIREITSKTNGPMRTSEVLTSRQHMTTSETRTMENSTLVGATSTVMQTTTDITAEPRGNMTSPSAEDNLTNHTQYVTEHARVSGNHSISNDARRKSFDFFNMLSEHAIMIAAAGTFLILLIPLLIIVIFKKACKRRKSPTSQVQIERSIDYQLGSEVAGFTYEPLAQPRPRYQSFRKGFKRFSKRPWSDREEESSDDEL